MYHLVGDANSGEAVHGGGRGYMGHLYLPLNFVVNLKMLFKKISSFFFFFLGLHPQHMEVPMLQVKSELQLLAYTGSL